MSNSTSTTISPSAVAGPSRYSAQVNSAEAGPSTPAHHSPLLSQSLSLSSISSTSSYSGKGKGKAKNKGDGKVRSSLSREVSRTSSITSPLERAADSARRAHVKARIAETVQRRASWKEVFICGIIYLVNKIVPFNVFRASTRDDSSDADSFPSLFPSSSSSISSSSFNIADDNLSPSGTSSVSDDLDAALALEFANLNAEQKAGMSSQEQTEEDTLSDASTEITEEDVKVPPPSTDPFDFPKLGLYWTNDRLNKRLEEHRAQVKRAEAHGQRLMKEKYLRQRREEDLKRAHDKEGARRTTMMEKANEAARQASERVNAAIEDREDERSRERLLRRGRQAIFDLMDERETSAIEKLRVREKELHKALGLDVLEHTTVNTRYSRRFRSRRIPLARFHPYSSRIRPSRPTSSRYFNQSRAFYGPAFGKSSARVKIPFKKKYVQYTHEWIALKDPHTVRELTFRTIPWPLVKPPLAPDEIISDDIYDFLLNAFFGSRDVDVVRCRGVAEYELHKWCPDRVEDWILRRIPDEDERRAARVGADVVLKALVIMASWDVDFFNKLKEKEIIRYFLEH
ncbi:hypothetical protein ACEPAI_1528 [Sanghuangporus weigelae]